MNRPLPNAQATALEETYWWYRARQAIICDTVRRFLPSGSNILDFGAGSGLISQQLVELGYRVVAADVAPDALAACQARQLDTLDLTRDEPVPASVDCILACDVLEHRENEVAILQNLRPSLRFPGLLIVAVPAYDFLWSGEDYVSNHVRRYTRPLLEERIRAAGFDIEWSSYFDTLLLPLIITAVFYKRLFRPRDMYASDVRPMPAWQNNILYNIFAAERNILPQFCFPAGASILLVARSAKF